DDTVRERRQSRCVSALHPTLVRARRGLRESASRSLPCYDPRPCLQCATRRRRPHDVQTASSGLRDVHCRRGGCPWEMERSEFWSKLVCALRLCGPAVSVVVLGMLEMLEDTPCHLRREAGDLGNLFRRSCT